MRHSTRRHRSRRKSVSLAAASVSTLVVAAWAIGVQGNAFGTEGTASASGGTAAEEASPSPAAEKSQECGAGDYQAEVAKSGDTWTARHGDTVVYTGDDMFAAMNAGLSSLTPNRTAKERLVVRGSGTISASERLKLPS